MALREDLKAALCGWMPGAGPLLQAAYQRMLHQAPFFMLYCLYRWII